MTQLALLDVVALEHDVPEAGLVRGQVGTIAEELEPGVFEVEFADTNGRTYATAAVPAQHLIKLLHERRAAAA